MPDMFGRAFLTNTIREMILPESVHVRVPANYDYRKYLRVARGRQVSSLFLVYFCIYLYFTILIYILSEF